MRHKVLRTALALALSACSGGEDVTSPPGSFTLTVAGDGSGSGRVATDPGVAPALSCDLAGSAAPSGTCSASYPEGTAVGLTVTPAAGSSFDGWAGDAASCGTAAACSLTMSSNQTVTARLSSSAGATGVEVASSAFYPQPDLGPEGAVIWVVEVRNAGAQLVESAEIIITTRDAAGAVLATSTTLLGPIPPGETRATQSFADYQGTEASADFQVGDVQFGSVNNLGAAEIVSSSWQPDPIEGFITWTVAVRNTTSSQLESVDIEFSTYDAAGKIVGASFTFVGPIAPGETQSGEGTADYLGTEATAKFQVAGIGGPVVVARRR
jgi:hypothetical protein